ncbi:11364_t:CDS:2 [Funneliformis geosporum]|uniref:11364_t:CDS:1 n=1 Tax=Funneliformis geosporum TaxID=1117311 RepID=A0A9W4T2S9_9GLOM|nr:11364_t:CDS:2 [Funneliformis geosporum]
MDNITKNQKQQLKNLPPLLPKYQQANIFKKRENVEFSKLYNNDNMDLFSRNYLPSKNLKSSKCDDSEITLLIAYIQDNVSTWFRNKRELIRQYNKTRETTSPSFVSDGSIIDIESMKQEKQVIESKNKRSKTSTNSIRDAILAMSLERANQELAIKKNKLEIEKLKAQTEVEKLKVQLEHERQLKEMEFKYNNKQ